MILRRKHSPDMYGTPGDPSDAQVRALLERAFTTTPPPHLREAMDRTVQARMAALPAAAAPARRAPAPIPRRRSFPFRLTSVVAATLVAFGGVAGYLHLAAPAPASAQTILRRAAALRLAPNQAAHLVESVSMAIGSQMATGTADVWLQADAGGATALSAQTLTLAKPGAPAAAPALSSRYIQVGQQLLAYNPEMRADNSILLSPVSQSRGYPGWVLPNTVFDGASVAQSLSTLAQQSPQQVRLLPPETLDGVAVDVIEVDGWANRPGQRTTLYFDAQSYVLRGFDATSLDPSYASPSWQVRLSSETTMAAPTVPPLTFALNAPATAIARLDLGGPAFRAVAAAVTAACHGTSNVKEMVRPGQSLLAACQASAPGVTEAGLVAALAAPEKAALDAAVPAGVITPAQAATYLGQVQAQLSAWITAAPPATAGVPRK